MLIFSLGVLLCKTPLNIINNGIHAVLTVTFYAYNYNIVI